ncbi:hypothetical protein [Epilithonimonas hominis]|uniref:hypothetical protein n=1 Tax=Epilithonimonas hominis TaxID=420404 RepID=UPI00289AC7EC|nr:hypothetical protein [Epilithonimonas hominis]
MKKLSFTLGLILFSQIISAQTKLENIYKVEIGLQGLSVGTEIPLNDKFLADVNIGWGGITDLWHNGISYEWSKNSNSIFARGQIRYYINRERREEKGHSLKNNAGTFLAYQTKFLFSGTEYYSPQVGKSWLNEIQFGQQLPLGTHFIFRYYGGVGNGYDLDNKNNKFYPAIGFAFGYAF